MIRSHRRFQVRLVVQRVRLVGFGTVWRALRRRERGLSCWAFRGGMGFPEEKTIMMGVVSSRTNSLVVASMVGPPFALESWRIQILCEMSVPGWYVGRLSKDDGFDICMSAL